MTVRETALGRACANTYERVGGSPTALALATSRTSAKPRCDASVAADVDEAKSFGTHTNTGDTHEQGHKYCGGARKPPSSLQDSPFEALSARVLRLAAYLQLDNHLLSSAHASGTPRQVH